MVDLDFEALAAKYQALALRVAWEFLYREHDVQEVVQEALLACWERRRRLTSDAAFRRLLLGAVVNQCRKRRRDYTRRPADTTVKTPIAAGPDEQAVAAERLETLKAALAELDAADRAAVVLCLVEGVSYEEAALVLETSVPAVRNRIYRARKALRQKLEELLG